MSSDDKVGRVPKVVKLNTLWSQILAGLTVDNIKKVTVYETAVHIWFSDPEEERPWDLTIEHPTKEDALDDYHALLDAMRKIRVRGI